MPCSPKARRVGDDLVHICGHAEIAVGPVTPRAPVIPKACRGRWDRGIWGKLPSDKSLPSASAEAIKFPPD